MTSSSTSNSQIFSTIAEHGPVIAVDLDDVLSQTSRCAAEWHNREYGSDMQLSTFYYSMWYKNPGWGTVLETLDKVKIFYGTDQLRGALPVPGALEGLSALRDMGFELLIVTARIVDHELDSTVHWLQEHFDGVFKYVAFSAQANESLSERKGYLCIGTILTKLQICTTVRSVLLIDDLMEIALKVGRHGQFPVLLFGEYEWNKRVDAGDKWGFQEKLEAEGGREWWLDDTVEVQETDKIWRIRSWEEVVAWVRSAQQEGNI